VTLIWPVLLSELRYIAACHLAAVPVKSSAIIQKQINITILKINTS